MELRSLIRIVEAASVATTSAASFEAVTTEAVVRACIDDRDLAGTMGGFWGLYVAPTLGIAMPASSAALSPEQLAWLCSDMAGDIAESRQRLAPIAAQPLVPVKRVLAHFGALTKPLGVHWSWAEAEDLTTIQFGDHTIHGVVANRHVDWVRTIAYGKFFWQEEAEITIRSGSPVRLTKLEFGDETTGIA